jgi:hypothetical protein
VTPDRSTVLLANRAVREGALPAPRRLDFGETTFRIPESDYFVLRRIYPALASQDAAERFAAWKDLLRSPIGEKYRVTRSARQVLQSDKRIVIK